MMKQEICRANHHSRRCNNYPTPAHSPSSQSRIITTTATTARITSNYNKHHHHDQYNHHHHQNQHHHHHHHHLQQHNQHQHQHQHRNPHHQQQHQQQQQQHRQFSNPKMLSLISIIVTYVVLISIAPITTEAKPLNSNQVRFRRLPPKEFSAALGSSITIECEAGGSPPPTIHWLKDGKRILQNQFDENQLEDGQADGIQVDDVNRIALSATRSRLFIDCADLTDEATYTCVAENSFSRISSHTKLNLIKPTSISKQQLSGDENELLNGGQLDEVAALELAAAAAAAAAGGGDQQFKQMDGTNDNNNKASLSALPQCLSQRGARLTAEPVRIHMWTHNIVEIMKNNVVLYCRSNVKKQQVTTSEATNNDQSKQLDQQQQQQQEVDTSKRLFVTWTLPDDKLVSVDQKDKYEILETGDLLIKDLRWADMGSYVCTVSDDQGSDSVSTFVYPASVKASNVNRPQTKNKKNI